MISTSKHSSLWPVSPATRDTESGDSSATLTDSPRLLMKNLRMRFPQTLLRMQIL